MAPPPAFPGMAAEAEKSRSHARLIAHIREKACPGLDPGWTPVFRQGYAPREQARAHPDSSRSGCALVTKRWAGAPQSCLIAGVRSARGHSSGAGLSAIRQFGVGATAAA